MTWRPPRAATVLLAFVGGVVDACTYLALYGLFVAQVTGSFVIVGAQMFDPASSTVIRTLAIPVFFLAGFATAFAVAIIGHQRAALVWTIGGEMILIVGFAVVGLMGAPFAGDNAPLAVIASVLSVGAMGVQGAMARLLMRGVSSTNVMTSNTTQAAIDLAQWMTASRRARRHPHDADVAGRHAQPRFARLWPIIAGFFAGTIAGVIVFRAVGFWCPMVSLTLLAGLLVWMLLAQEWNR